ncbi:mechanosensitive ion channel [Fulvimarina sp. 2208YS6-2-32]|uniref:Mechanosensitive ion channel n=1 Tax=Fulvimarina uroteuthidis TaxID=3098149 RepID=A0ABU5I639_9HYPH|nr:mechanosensitive ion channel domain-containing protein [Fulvimarina sp. 2208YS6-2-32]MDY8110274.1 mechanosensitive ion channel [Fulvimarina sp. 2208YS6-2-32]
MRLLTIAMALACLVVSGMSAGAQSDSGPATRWFEVDSLNEGLPPTPPFVDRDTPQAMMETFWFAGQDEDWGRAMYTLNLNGVAPEIRSDVAPFLTERLFEVIQRGMSIDWNDYSDRPDALEAMSSSKNPMAGETRRNIRLGVLELQNRPVSIRIERLKPEDGEPVWVFSSETVANINALYEIYGPSRLEQAMPEVLRAPAFWTLKWWEVIALPLVFLLALGAGGVAYKSVARVKRRKVRRIVREILDAVQVPIALLAFVGVFSLVKGFLFTFSGPVSQFLGPLQTLLFVTALALIAVRIVDAILERLVARNMEDLTENEDADTRDLYTNISAIRRMAVVVAILVGGALILIQTNAAQTLGFSLLASAGVIGLILAFAARTLLADIMASLQIAIAKTARIGDAILWQGNWCYVEKIKFTHVQVRSWDERRLIIPVSELVSNTFENWSKQDPTIVKLVELRLDHRADVDALREAFEAFVKDEEDITDKSETKVQVVGHDATGMLVRFVAPAPDPIRGWNMQCRMREHLLASAARLEDTAGGEPGGKAAYFPREREVKIGENMQGAEG